MFDHLSVLETAITKVLSLYYPLSQKDLIKKIEDLEQRIFSVAGVQKALSSLLAKGILHKHSKYYQLRTDRLLDEKKKIQGILDRYMHGESYHLFLRKEVRYYTETLSQLDLFWNAVVEQWFNFYPQQSHAFWQRQPIPWFTVMHSDEERRIAHTICKHCTEFRTYSVDSEVSRQVQPIYTELPNSSLHFIKHTEHLEHAYSVYGDHIIETRQPPAIAAILKRLANAKSKSIGFDSIIDLSAPGSYEIIVTKDAKKAERYRQALVREAGE